VSVCSGLLEARLRVNRHTYPGVLSFHSHIGQGRQKETRLLFDRDIVFSTYATVATEYSRGESPLSAVNWFRIVLDEGK
jgi:SWI/SNF-related matrix-associated actin-dependent regulator of chromatin subfamily A3